MGITRSNQHKRRKSGAKRTSHRLKKKYEIGRQTALTKLGGHRVRSVRVRGGNFKTRALRLHLGNFAWGSEGIAKKAKILDVVYNAANNEYVRTNTLVKGSVVLIDAAPFRRYFEKQYNQPIAKISTEITEEDKLTEKQKKRFSERVANQSQLEAEFQKQFNAGKLLAIVTSRPGQCGRADGVVLEGEERDFYVKRSAHKKRK